MTLPIVLVYQTLAKVNVTTTIPDLTAVLVGPAYDLQDYPEDASNILLADTYGTADGSAGNSTFDTYVPPTVGTDVVTVLGGAYPQQSAGSVVDHDSVRVHLRYPRVVMGSTHSSVTPQLGTSIKTVSTDQTLIELVGMIGTGFVGAGIQPGDRIILTSSYGTVEQTVVRTVASVGEPNAAGLVASGNEKFLRLSQNLPASGTGAADWTYANSGGHIRIERQLVIQEFVDTTRTFITFPEPGSDKFVLKGGVTLNVTVQPVATVSTPAPVASTAARKLAYSELYLSYRALRQDLQEVTSFDASAVTTVNGIGVVNGLGKIDARNPLATAVSVALKNSGTAPVYAIGVPSDDATGHQIAREVMSARRDIYAITPLTSSLDIIAAYRNEVVGMADPDQALADGVPQKFRMVLGSVDLPQSEVIYSDSISGVAQQPSGANSGYYRTLQMAASSTDAIDVSSVLPGDSITIGLVPSGVSSWATRRGTHLVSHVNSSKNYPNPSDPSAIELIPGSSRWDSTGASGSGDIEVLIKAPDGTVKVSSLARVTVTQNTSQVRYQMLVPTVLGGPYTVSYRIVPGIAAVGVALTGFAVAISVDGTSHTADDVAAAVNAHATVGALMSATVVANGTSIINDIVPLTDAVSGQTGSGATVSAVASGIATLTGLTGMTVSSVGRHLTITGAAVSGNNGVFVITEYVSATSVKIANAAANAVDGNNGSIGWAEKYNYQAVSPASGACTAEVVANDDLFNRLEDSSALFITNGVKAGDVIEIPIDPNNYTADAFDGRVLSYTVAAVLSETRLLIANGVDDTSGVAKELPHYFLRDYPNRYLDNTTPSAIAYRVLRVLDKDGRVVALTGRAQSVRSGRCVLTWPDRVKVSDLRDGSLPRSTATVREKAGWQPGYYATAAVAGAIAGLPAQHGLTGLGFSGIESLQHATDYFSEKQLARLSDGGFFVLVTKTPGALPTCIHQLTTDPTTLQSGELSVVKNVDFVSLYFIARLELFLSGYNVTKETLNLIQESVNNGRDDLVNRTIAKIGPPLVSGELTSIAPSDVDASRVELYFEGKIPVPLNTIAFRLVL